MKLTVLIPCLNEEETLEKVIKQIQDCLRKEKLNKVAEILISDNGSTDNSVKIAKKNKARVVECSDKGYGNALLNGIKNAKGDYIIMGDADMSYNFYDIGKFVDKLDEGYDLVVGNRFKGGIEKGAMSFSHRLGIPFLSGFANFFFKTPVKDFHCGLRSFRKDKINEINLNCGGMEFASEMICKASLYNLKMIEIPTKLFKDQRNKKSHLKTIRDGFRHVFCILNIKFKYNKKTH